MEHFKDGHGAWGKQEVWEVWEDGEEIFPPHSPHSLMSLIPPISLLPTRFSS